MEHLTKHQLVLIALLVSFITSIATGIVTASLVEQGSQAPSYTINRIVERTIEKVVPQDSKGQVVQKETIVVQASDQAVGVVEKNIKSLVNIKAVYGDHTDAQVGVGIVVSEDGYILADVSILNRIGAYFARFNEGKTIPLEVATSSNVFGVVVLRPAAGVTDKPKFIPVELGDSDDVKLAQTVISLGSAERATVSLGIIRARLERTVENDQLALILALKGSYIYAFKTDINSPDIDMGSPLLNLRGEVIGMKTTKVNIDEKGNYLPINLLKTLLP